jgi:hypothetical protein
MKYNKLTDHSLNKKNPFFEDTVEHIVKGQKTIFYTGKSPDLIISQEGEVKGHSIFARKTKIDKAEFMKVYKTGLANWYDLSKSAIKIFAFISSILKPNKDYFDFDLDDCKAFTGYSSKNTILNAISELIANKFIARGSNPYKYFINPTIFFNGNRLIFLEQFDIIDDKEQEKIQSNSES